MVKVFWMSHFLILWTMIFYPVIMNCMSYIIRKKENTILKDEKKINSYEEPLVSLIIVAHNEEKVIEKKLLNVLSLNYPKEKLEVIISSDNSTDKTNYLVRKFIDRYDLDWFLYEVKERKGKTNAQNEAVKIASGDVLVFTDANSELEKNSIIELTNTLEKEDVGYVCGNLQLQSSNLVSKMESTYWNVELNVRFSESYIYSIVTGNGALYACRKKDFIEIPLIESHDSGFPYRFVLSGKKSLYNENALVYESAGLTHEDEYKRKVRMNRVMLDNIMPDIRLLNFVKYRSYPLFYLSHRSFRYLLWLFHLLLTISSFVLFNKNWYYKLVLVAHLFFYSLFFVDPQIIKTKVVKIFYYYSLTIKAQYHALMNEVLGKTKPFWEKAETTRR